MNQHVIAYYQRQFRTVTAATWPRLFRAFEAEISSGEWERAWARRVPVPARD